MTPGSFLRDQWYAAATSAEIGAKPLGRKICNEDIVLFRRSDGAVAALEDRCPHRRAPLSLGQLVGGEIECPYHGLRFDGAGVCTLIPSQHTIPRGLDTPAYPAIERHSLVFVWIGDAAKADPAQLPDWSPHTSPEWTTVHGYHHVKANYLLLLDNLLDLSHLAFVHRSTLGASGPSDWLKQQDVATDGEVVSTRRVMRDVAPSGLVRATKRFVDGKIDRFQTSWFRLPSYVLVSLGAEAAGSRDDMEFPHHIVPNNITPETETTTHYFWSVARRYALGDEEISRLFFNVTKAAFDEDAVMIEAQQRMIASDPRNAPLANLDGDAAGVAARRLIARKLKEQAAETQAAA
jgi:phenylpropionate dioxygenase-like ring-hydroxylating dioxygenase large terminal subunit